MGEELSFADMAAGFDKAFEPAPTVEDRTGWIVLHVQLVGSDENFHYRISADLALDPDVFAPDDHDEMLRALQPDGDGFKFYGQRWIWDEDEGNRWSKAAYVWIPTHSVSCAVWSFQKEMQDISSKVVENEYE